jgi:hypothetical protein
MFIPDHGSWLWIFSIPDPGSAAVLTWINSLTLRYVSITEHLLYKTEERHGKMYKY